MKFTVDIDVMNDAFSAENGGWMELHQLILKSASRSQFNPDRDVFDRNGNLVGHYALEVTEEERKHLETIGGNNDF